MYYLFYANAPKLILTAYVTLFSIQTVFFNGYNLPYMNFIVELRRQIHFFMLEFSIGVKLVEFWKKI